MLRLILIIMMGAALANAVFYPAMATTMKNPLAEFTSLLTKLASPQADACNASPVKLQYDANELYDRLFSIVESDLLAVANAAPAKSDTIAIEWPG